LVATDSVISWSHAKTRAEELTEEDMKAGTNTLLEDFLALASADPEEMGAFMRLYGVLALCGAHGRPNEHEQGDFCPWLMDDGRFAVSVQAVRRAARAFADLHQWGNALRNNQRPPAGSGMDTQRLLPGFLVGRHVTDHQRIAHYLTRLNRETGVRPLVTWDERLSVTYAAEGLMGVLTILLTRKIQAPGALSFKCSVCGDLVDRGNGSRPPHPDEAVYCPKESCKREQRRRNQAAWRARKRAEGKS
jgi:hypothetical protein